MKLHVPLSELELSFAHTVTQTPQSGIGRWGGALREYITEHIRPATPAGRPWSIQVQHIHLGDVESLHRVCVM